MAADGTWEIRNIAAHPDSPADLQFANLELGNFRANTRTQMRSAGALCIISGSMLKPARADCECDVGFLQNRVNQSPSPSRVPSRRDPNTTPTPTPTPTPTLTPTPDRRHRLHDQLTHPSPTLRQGLFGYGTTSNNSLTDFIQPVVT